MLRVKSLLTSSLVALSLCIAGNADANPLTPIFDTIFGQLGSPGAASANMKIIDPRAWNMSTSGLSTTGSCLLGSNVVNLAGALDFANGEGVRFNHCGTPFTLNLPTSPIATAAGTLGTTTYQYKLATIDGLGGVGAATASFQVTNANAVLSVTNYVSITATVPSGTAPAGYVVYRNIAGTFTPVGFITSATPYFYDFGYGYSVAGLPDYVPATPPTAALSDWLVSTIQSGGGTTTLTLATAAGTTQTSTGAYHDETAAFNVAVTQAQLTNDNVLTIPWGTENVTGNVPITNSLFLLRGFGIGSNINRINPTGDLFTFTGGKDTIEDLLVSANAFQVSGYLFNLGSAGNDTISHLRTYGGPGVINLTSGGAQDIIHDFVFNNFTKFGISEPAGYGGLAIISQGQMLGEPQVNIGRSDSRGVSITGGGTLKLDQLNVAGQQNPCYIVPDAGQSIYDVEATTVSCDGQGVIGPPSISGNAWTLDGSNAGSMLHRFRGANLWGGSMGNNGLYAKHIDSGWCDPCAFEANGANGAAFYDTHNFWVNVQAFGNNFNNVSADGVYGDSTISLMRFSGQSGESGDATTPTQRYCWNVSGYTISDVGTLAYGCATATYYWAGAAITPTPSNY